MSEKKLGDVGKSQKRVFINKAESYSSRYISKFLSEHAIGDNPDSSGEEEREKKKQEGEKDQRIFGHNGAAAFHMCGTVGAQSEEITWLTEQYFQPSKEQLLLNLMKCDVIIYNISQHCQEVDEASWALQALHHNMADFSRPKRYILVSTVMTWAKSKPDTHDEEELPFTDANYRTRRAHPAFRKHIDLEKKVVKMGKTNKNMFSTCVVASGLQYGMGEQIFNIFFKMSWLGVKEIPVFGEGKNIVPTIHINSLASVIHNLIDCQPQTYYLLAVDSANNTMEEIVKAVASALGPGTITQKPFEDIYLHQDLTMMEIDSLSVSLHMEAVHVRKFITGVQWVCESGLVENMELVVEEYRQTRGLLPICVCVIGPPVVGKSSVSQQICDSYRLHHVTVTETISETLAHLEDVVQNPDSDDDDATLEERKLLNDLKEDMQQNGGFLSDNLLVRVMRDKLKSHPCKNQGCVLDGFPMTYQLAKETFVAEDNESGDEAIPTFTHDRIPLPELVLVLDAPDALLRDRVINLSEKVAQERNYQEETFCQRLAKYRQNNMAAETVVNYFEELAVPTLHMTISSSSCERDHCLLMQKVIEKVGEPRRCGLTSHEVEAEDMRQTEERIRRERQRSAEEDQKEAEETSRRASNWEQWATALKNVKQQEDELLEEESIPLKNYLIKHVMPTLSQGLKECCSIQPHDPVDFLAEYLMKNNPATDRPTLGNEN
ncbi:adenylate kinase 7-like [Synchiropus picturatus]